MSSYPELGTILDIERLVPPHISERIQIMASALLGKGSFISIGGDLTTWYDENPTQGLVRTLSDAVIRDWLRYRPTRRRDDEWYNLTVRAWRGVEDYMHIIPVGEGEPGKDHALLRSMAWVEVPLEAEVTISTTPETHEEAGSIIVSPGQLFIATAGVRELAVSVPEGSTNMELLFDQHYRRR